MKQEIVNNNNKIEYLINNSDVYIPDHEELTTCVAFATDVYNDVSASPFGWQRFAQIKTDSGYFGAVYLSPIFKNKYGTNVRGIIFAHRGTNSILDLIEDISILRERPFQQIYDAVNFVWEVGKKIMELLNKEQWIFDDIRHTGHSLGAILSDICGSFMLYYLPLQDYMHARSITFENPGSKNIAAQAYSKLINMFPNTTHADAQKLVNTMAENCWAIQSPINIINSCNEQAGVVMRLIDKEHHIDQDYAKSCVTNPFSISAKWEGNLRAYVKINTLDQHLIDPIVDYLTANRRTVIETNPVFGLQPAYKEFLNYETNKSYWDAYFSAIYDASGRQDREQFFKYALDELKSAHDYTLMLVDEVKDDAEFVVVPSALEKRGMFAVKPKPMDVVPTPYNDVVPTPYNDEVPTPYDNKSSYCRIM